MKPIRHSNVAAVALHGLERLRRGRRCEDRHEEGREKRVCVPTPA